MGLRFAKAYREHDKLRKSFFRLARETFGLDFAPWYQGGWWTDHYIPYSFIDGEEVVANVSVNRMELEHAGSWHYGIQVGTAMTRPEYRGQGLCRRLLERVLEEWQDHCDILYLLANDSVLDLYPKFGFQPAEEPLHSGPLHRTPGPLRPLDLSEEGDRKLLLDCYRASNPSSALTAVGDPGLLMFYCGGALREHLYYAGDARTVIVAERAGDTLLCHDLLGEGAALELAGRLARPGIARVTWGFTPKDPAGMQLEQLQEEDTTLFLLEGTGAWFRRGDLRLPALSRT